MSLPTDPRGPDSGTVAVRVEYVHRDHPPCQIILLSDPYGLMLHYVKDGSIPCTWPAPCKAHTGRPPKYHGFAAVLYRVSTRPEIWEHRVFDCSAGYCRRLDGRPVRGERWELSAPPEEGTGRHPVVAQYLGLVHADQLPRPCDVLSELRRFFGWREIPASQGNPIPGYQHLPPVHLTTEPEVDVQRPAVYVPPPASAPAPQIDAASAAKLAAAEKIQQRAGHRLNGTAERLIREAAERLRAPKS